MTDTAFNQTAFAQETDVAIFALLTLKADSSEEYLRFTNMPYEKFSELGENVYGCKSNGETFIFLPFDIRLPQDDKTGVVRASLDIDNIDRQIIPYIRSNITPITMNVQTVLSSDVDNVQLEFDAFKLTNVTYDAFKITGDISLEYLDLEPFPSGRFTPSGFPGLF